MFAKNAERFEGIKESGAIALLFIQFNSLLVQKVRLNPPLKELKLICMRNQEMKLEKKY